jgi:peptide/nickel transport system substrate-binding protein
VSGPTDLVAAGNVPAVAHADTVRVAIAQEPTTLNPLLEISDYENFVTRMVFDRLVTPDVGGKRLLPRLAAIVPTVGNGGISRDGKTIVYHLRHDVRWQDGVPFTSRDVAFSFAAVLDASHDVVNRRGFDLVASVKTPDAYTAIVRLKQPFAPAITWFFGDGNNYAILPAHAFARAADFNRGAFNAAPIGTGPFRVVRWKRGDAIELAAFDRYYRGTPKLRRIVVRFVPDESTAIDLMRTHEIDAFALASTSAYRQLRTIPGVSVALTDNHGATTVTMNTSHPALQDVRVRRAIVAAIDKRAIAQKITGGAGKPATEDLPDFMWAYDPHVGAQAYDPAAARALLRAAGYVSGPGGVLARGGKPLQLVFAFTVTNASARIAAVQVPAYLRAVGIDVIAKGYNGAQFFAGYSAGGILQNGSFDLAWYTMTLGIDPDTSGRFTCASIPPNGQDYSRYCSPEMDAAEAIGIASPEQSRRRAAYGAVQRLLARDAPIDFVYWPKSVDAFDARLKGIGPNPVVASWNAEDWTW